jgi:undecaprenyl-diphosphatase
LDLALLHLLNRPGDPALDAVMAALSSRWLLLPLLGACALFIALRSRRRWPGALVLVAAVGLSDLAGARLLKPAFARVRPCAEVPPRAVAAFGCASGRSFPSNHAANAAAAAVVLAWSSPLWGIAGGALALLVGASRVYLGVHWPSDVLAGWLLGAALAGALAAAARASRFASQERTR